jgi:hypothetical protein
VRLLLLPLLVACSRAPSPPASANGRGPGPDASAAPAAVTSEAPSAPGRRPSSSASSAPSAASSPGRVVAIGDVHGDLAATRAALRLAGAIDASDNWIGGASLTVVQLGDQLDRGDDEREILDFFVRLSAAAAAAGGRFVALNGNHELMNVAGDFRYVTRGGFEDWGDPDGRRAAFAPGAEAARLLATRSIFAIVGDSVFVHAGLLPAWADREVLAAADAEARSWMLGERATIPRVLDDEDGPIWTRRYGLAAPGDDGPCADAAAALQRLGVRRMVIAHTVQEHGINSICDGRVWRVDVGLAAAYGGPLQVLEIPATGEPRILRGEK